MKKVFCFCILTTFIIFNACYATNPKPVSVDQKVSNISQDSPIPKEMKRLDVVEKMNDIELSKNALFHVRQAIETKCLDFYAQMNRDLKEEESKILAAPWSIVELNNGIPTEAARQRRESKVSAINEKLHNKFFSDCEEISDKYAFGQDKYLLEKIRVDQKALEQTWTTSSTNDGLIIDYGLYDGNKNGWKIYVSLYSGDKLIYNDSFILNYEAITGKKAPDIAKEPNDTVIAEYANTVEMYTSFFTHGEPILSYELDYIVKAEEDDMPSQYSFTFKEIRVISTSGEIVQTNGLGKTRTIAMTPATDLREKVGIVTKEKAQYDPVKYKAEYYMVTKNLSRQNAENLVAKEKFFGINMIQIPNQNIEMMPTEVTQKLYNMVMGKNPSYNKGNNFPVECVDWYEAIKFCNALSVKVGLIPVYTINGEQVTFNKSADGFRLPTIAEWRYAAKGGQNYRYAGSSYLDEVAWYVNNSNNKTHPVGQKKPNNYGLYDMCGNVEEWCWDANQYQNWRRSRCGGSYQEMAEWCELSFVKWESGKDRLITIGIRIVRNLK